MATLIGPAQTKGAPLASTDTIRISLAPSPGFCIKSVITDAGFYTYKSTPPSSSPSVTNPSLLEPSPKPQARTLTIPKGVKVFLNIAWDKHVPAPPEASEEVVRRAMAGADLDDEDAGVLGAYYVPVVVSEPREDVDKSGKPSIVFDCVFSASLKSRCMKDKEFKMYLIELALEHAEEKTHMTLSRQVGTPNIAAKGKLEPRTVLMPRALVDPDSAAKNAVSTPLVQELPDPAPAVQDTDKEGKGSMARGTNDISDKTNASTRTNGERKPKSILKTSSAATANTVPGASEGASASAGGKRPLIEEIKNGVRPVVGTESGSDAALDENALTMLPPLRWKWVKDEEWLKIEIEMPDLNRELHTQSTLDIEPRRILLHVPQKYFLDINLELSDAQIGKVGTVHASEDDAKETTIAESMNVRLLRMRGHNAGEALRLKRQREFDVERARAQWRVGDGKLVISV